MNKLTLNDCTQHAVLLLGDWRMLCGGLAAVLLLAACGGSPAAEPPPPPPPTISAPPPTLEDVLRSELAGGQATVFDTTPNAFSQPAPGLTNEEERLFFVGNSFFNQNWVTAPASTTARDGLGPLFNARSCASCHFKDGRGGPPAADPQAPTGFLLRLSIPGQDIHYAPLPDPIYGGQLQINAIEGVQPEGTFQVTYTEIEGQFADGTPYSLRQPTYTITEWAYGQPHPEIMLSPRVANQLIGLGLLEAVPEADLLAQADPTDADGDGISGRPNYVWDDYNNRQALGRFGWKANQPHLLQQTAAAFNGDMGITSGLFPLQNCTTSQEACRAAISGGGPPEGAPEIIDEDLLKVVLYTSTLAVPARRNIDDLQVLRGEQIFQAANCHACHTPQLVTGVHPSLPALSHQVIYPYTDLLLHDMGEGLADGRPDFQAGGAEWRTPPLWGMGLVETVNGHTFFLHDGRARSLMEAVLWHGGEAEQARDYVLELDQDERDALIAFLESL